MPFVRIGHGLYTPDLRRSKGQALIRLLKESGAVLEFQITSNVRLNNLTGMRRHPLRQYLAYGIGCVQGTDGGALYGSDSIDEQLSLEKMLGLRDEEMLKMRMCEDRVLERSLENFKRKSAEYENTSGTEDEELDHSISLIGKRSLPAAQVLAEKIIEMPADKEPIVIVGGSFSRDTRKMRMTEENKRRIDELLEREGAEPHHQRRHQHHQRRDQAGQIPAEHPGKVAEHIAQKGGDQGAAGQTLTERKSGTGMPDRHKDVF